jgi:hypothetical protein
MSNQVIQVFIVLALHAHSSDDLQLVGRLGGKHRSTTVRPAEMGSVMFPKHVIGNDCPSLGNKRNTCFTFPTVL